MKIKTTVYNILYRLGDQQLRVQQPTAQEDEVKITNLASLEKESLQYLQTLDPFCHTVSTFRYIFIEI
jgi:hypothetical protein